MLISSRAGSFAAHSLHPSLHGWRATTSTTILGVITDTSGAVVPGAKVTALNVKTGLKREETTSSTGDFSFPLLDVGEYDVSVDAQGFKSEVRHHLILQINEKTRVDFALQVGLTTERVDVSAGTVALRTDEATLGETVEQRRVEELPLNNRNLGALAILQPGVQYAPRAGTDGRVSASGRARTAFRSRASASFVANGQRD
jgi:hypothetical protein